MNCRYMLLLLLLAGCKSAVAPPSARFRDKVLDFVATAKSCRDSLRADAKVHPEIYGATKRSDELLLKVGEAQNAIPKPSAPVEQDVLEKVKEVSSYLGQLYGWVGSVKELVNYEPTASEIESTNKAKAALKRELETDEALKKIDALEQALR
jgi:hypothetical protein